MSHFTDHLSSELSNLKKDNNTDITEMPALDFYKATILQSLEGNWDDLEDLLNIQQALIRILELNQENIRQCVTH